MRSGFARALLSRLLRVGKRRYCQKKTSIVKPVYICISTPYMRNNHQPLPEVNVVCSRG